MMSKVSFLFLIYIFVSSSILSQTTKVVSDFRLKTQLSVNYELSKKIEFELAGQAYLEKNASTFDEYFLEAEGKYKLMKLLHLSIGYRYTWNYSPKDKKWNGLNRLNADIILRHKINRFRFSYRFRYQNIDDDLFLYSDQSLITDPFLRNRISLKYKIKNSGFYPFTRLEHYWNTGNGEKVNNKMKFSIGTQYAINKKHSLNFYYQIMQELTNYYPYTFHILFVSYTYKF